MATNVCECGAGQNGEENNQSSEDLLPLSVFITVYL